MFNWLNNEFAWMYWTWPSALFLGLIATAIIALTVWDIITPTTKRKGFLPIPTTRGDRLFIGIISSIGLYLIWLSTVGNQLLWMPLGLVVGWNVAMGWRG